VTGSQIGFVFFAIAAAVSWGVVAVLTAALLLGETLTWPKAVGATLVVVGVWLLKG